jgi:hypothetical protein
LAKSHLNLSALEHGVACDEPSGLGAYLRGLRGAIRGRKRMQQKHRDLMAKRKIDDAQLLTLMRMSERQVHAWQQSQPEGQRSSLLNLYFRIFKPR